MQNFFLKIFFVITIINLLVGCSVVQKDMDHKSADEYQNRAQLRQSLINSGESMSEQSIQKILSSKVVLPKTIQLAIIRLTDAREGLEIQMIDQEIAEKFYAKTNWGPNVVSVTPMPQIMVAKPITLSGLRQAAVILQADMLLIVKPVSYSDWKYQWIESDTAKTITSLEVLLLDTRTSIVPYTAIVTETAEVKKEATDYSNYELLLRSKTVSEAKALLKIVDGVQKFISKK